MKTAALWIFAIVGVVALGSWIPVLVYALGILFGVYGVGLVLAVCGIGLIVIGWRIVK